MRLQTCASLRPALCRCVGLDLIYRAVMLQVKHKYNGLMADIFMETFCWLPLGHVLNKRVLVVHGGLFSRDGVKLDDIRAINRYRCGLSLPHPWGMTNVASAPQAQYIKEHTCKALLQCRLSRCMPLLPSRLHIW